MRFLSIILLFSLTIGQVAKGQENFQNEDKPRSALTLGFLHGGGSLVGADFEILLTSRFSFQIGAGWVGFGGGINYHLKPTIKSSMISLQYFHQGVSDSYTQSMLGPLFVYRAKKLFTASLGFGYALEKGPAFPNDKNQPSAMLLYSIGIYLPIK